MSVTHAEAFATAWTVLARVLEAPPSSDVLDSVRSSELLEEWPLAGQAGHTSEPLAQGLASLAESRQLGESVRSVADDHMRLFRGPGSAAVSPYESVHRSREGLVFERETLQVRQWYSRFGLRAPRLDQDPDDQIHLELEFCATLLTRGLEAHDLGHEAEAQTLFEASEDFCREHLFQWAPAFFEALHKVSATHFYKGLAGLALDALQRAEDLSGHEVSSAK
ncbi:MAG: TorD/DmsD family molecular chaperone [Arachnia sp.]